MRETECDIYESSLQYLKQSDVTKPILEVKLPTAQATGTHN